MCDRNRDGVGDEEVDSSERGTDEELGDLHRGEGALDEVGHTVSESGQSVVCVL